MGDRGEDPVAAAFAELDLPRSTDENAVKRAYRERVKDVHPDQGGDEEAFHRVREAYATATEYCRRADGAAEPDRRPTADRSPAAAATARARRAARDRR